MNCGAGLGEAIPGIGLRQPGRNAQQGGLAGAIAPDQADPVAATTASSAPESRGVTPKVTMMSCSKSSGGGIAKEISRMALASGLVSVCQKLTTTLDVSGRG